MAQRLSELLPQALSLLQAQQARAEGEGEPEKHQAIPHRRASRYARRDTNDASTPTPYQSAS